MNPTLLDFLGAFSLPSYTTMVFIGFVLGTLVLVRWGRHYEVEWRLVVEFVVWMAIWGVMGSKLLHVIADGHFWDYVNVCIDPSKVDWLVDKRECKELKGAWDAGKGLCHPVQTNCLAWIDPTSPGFAFYGGFAAAALFAIRFVRRNKLPAGPLIDMGGVLLMLGLAWGRMGCFLAGCCFGNHTDCAMGLSFPPKSAASHFQWQEHLLSTYRHASLPVHPTQIYEAAAGLLIAALAYFVVMPRKRFHGQVFCFTAWAYAAARFALEFIRSDERGGLLWLSTSQWFAVAFAGSAAWIWVVFRKKRDRLLGKRS
ncbi:MAG: prolipoprotein diacylglyceryl transferase [Myxococcota bacterium]|jgi:phosphatidylglycerol:prolipoprotein diacylglycerol transferase|nr:prolipoprotein diacylglyceryl transferase [Myxococcota bacterium]